MNRPFSPRPPAGPFVRVNGKIRAREVRVIDAEGEQLGVLQLNDALNMARQRGVDLVEVAPNAMPPVCKLIDFGKYRYEQAKKDKEARKHQHGTKLKEIQLSANIDPHDFSVKLQHAIDFLCEDMKVKVSLRFRGREMAHTEFGFQQVNNFIKSLAPFGQADANPKLIGKGINVTINPLPRNKRAKNPNEGLVPKEPAKPAPDPGPVQQNGKRVVATNGAENPSESGFSNSPFDKIDTKVTH